MALLDDDKEAVKLKEKIRVLCWIMTSPQNLEKKAVHVRNTWAHRCNKLVFISSETNTSFPTVGINVPEGREHLTGKTMQAFRYIYNNHFNDADWFMKADDDTYVIIENLRYFLSSQNKEDPIYFGHHFQTIVKQGYFSGGAGYVLSKEAMRRFGERGNDTKLCRQDGGAEDAEFGKCMQNLGVKVGNSTDRLGRSRFHCFDPETHLRGGYPDWYYKYDAHGAKKVGILIIVIILFIDLHSSYNLESSLSLTTSHVPSQYSSRMEKYGDCKKILSPTEYEPVTSESGFPRYTSVSQRLLIMISCYTLDNGIKSIFMIFSHDACLNLPS